MQLPARNCKLSANNSAVSVASYVSSSSTLDHTARKFCLDESVYAGEASEAADTASLSSHTGSDGKQESFNIR